MSIQIENLTIQVGDQTIVNKASFKAASKQVTTIIGQNGAGKSSLLKAIIGDIPYQFGDILLNGKPLTSKNHVSQATSMAFLPQFSLLNFPYTVEEVIALGRTPHKTGYAIDMQIVDECLTSVNLQDFKQRLYPKLSGGEKQRVQLARVLAQIWREQDSQAPRVLILDEPLTALDLGHQQSLLQFLKAFCHKNVTILMVVHDINTAARYSDHLVVMKNGEIFTEGSPKQVMDKAMIDKAFDVDCNIIHSQETDEVVFKI